MRYEEVGKARFQTGQDADGAWLRIPARRNWFVLPFITVWLCGWTAGGIAAMTALFAHFEPFLVFWLCGWAFGWLFAAATLLWQLGGSELLRVSGGDLEYGVQLPGFRRRRGYRGNDIRDVSAAANQAWPFSNFNSYPPLFNMPRGSVRFSYGARTIYLAQRLDEAEGALIAEWLTQRLPLAARG